MSLISEVPAVVVAVTDPLDEDAHVGGVADSSILVRVTSVIAIFLVLRLCAICDVVATLFQRDACTGFLWTLLILMTTSSKVCRRSYFALYFFYVESCFCNKV